MTVQITNRLTEFRKAIKAVAQEIAPEAQWSSGTGPTKFAEQALDEQTFLLACMVGEASPENEDFLDELLDSHGPRSIRLALESDRNVAQAVDMSVTGASGVQHYRQPDGVVLGAEWRIKALFD
jgi:hypothetical protein